MVTLLGREVSVGSRIPYNSIFKVKVKNITKQHFPNTYSHHSLSLLLSPGHGGVGVAVLVGLGVAVLLDVGVAVLLGLGVAVLLVVGVVDV